MEKIEKVLLLAVLVAALLIIAVMSLFPEEKTSLDLPGAQGGVVYGQERGAKTANLEGTQEAGKDTARPSLEQESPDPKKAGGEDGGLQKLLVLEDGGEEPGEDQDGRFSGKKGALAKVEAPSGLSDSQGGVLIPDDGSGSAGGRSAKPGEEGEGTISRGTPLLEEGGQFFRYTIQKGDAFSTILEKVCGTARKPVRELVLAANEQLNENRIIAGHVLLIPKEAIDLGKRLLAQARDGRKGVEPSSSSVSSAGFSKPLANAGERAEGRKEPQVDAAVSGFAGIISLKRGEKLGSSEGSLYRTSPQAIGTLSRKTARRAIPGQARSGARVGTYTVKKGDSFWKIADKLLPRVPGESKNERGARIHRFVLKLQDLNPAHAGGALGVGNKIRVPR